MIKHGTTKQVFVAYPYTLYDKKMYRRAYEQAGAEYDVSFVFADERITSMHILEKIRRHIEISDFSIFDISGWNPNVTLELGVAYALVPKVSWYICYNPEKNAHRDVPSNMRGLDRIQYNSMSELNRQLVVLLEQWYPHSRTEALHDYEAQMSEKVVAILQRAANGLQTKDIANMLECSQGMARVLVDGLISDGKVKFAGAKKGKRYFLSD